jgi:hypothetical protein
MLSNHGNENIPSKNREGYRALRAHDIALCYKYKVQLQYSTPIQPANAHARPNPLSYHITTYVYFSVSASTPLCHALGTIVSLSLVGP